MLGFYVVCRQWQGNCIFVFCRQWQGRQWQGNCIFVFCRQWQGKQWLANTFCIFLKFCKHWAAATVLVVVQNALYLLVVDEKLFNDTNKYVYNFPT